MQRYFQKRENIKLFVMNFIREKKILLNFTTESTREAEVHLKIAMKEIILKRPRSQKNYKCDPKIKIKSFVRKH